MGPLYHLVYEEDRRQALAPVYERLTVGSMTFCAYISRLGIFGDLIRNVPDWIQEQAEVTSFIERGRRPDGWPKGEFRSYFARVEETAALIHRGRYPFDADCVQG
jgi:hypothetical protein